MLNRRNIEIIDRGFLEEITGGGGDNPDGRCTCVGVCGCRGQCACQSVCSCGYK